MTPTRRHAIALGLGAAAAGLSGCGPASTLTAPLGRPAGAAPGECGPWGRGPDGQRIADRGDGTFFNPVFSGDRPDPSIVREGEDYYLTFSSFDAYPGLMIWTSRDLVNWRPVGHALHTPIGSVWAPDLVRHDGRFFLYIPARTASYRSIYVIHADRPEGPWSEPIDLGLHAHIDPGHIVGEDGERYLFLSQGDRVKLTADGLATAGPVEHVYDPWRYPDDWDVECFCPEGPKMLRRGDWYYMITAVGGTAGPPTGHMVIAARSRSIHGPWEDAPNNPLVRTTSRDERWWSRGHATLIEDPEGGWWLIYHGYENGFWTLGRQCLLEPVRWREDGWFEAAGGDLSTPFAIPASAGPKQEHGLSLTDPFEAPDLAPQWAFYKPGPNEYDRVRVGDGQLSLTARGTRPADSSPLSFIIGDLTYTVEVMIDRDPGASAGLVLFYNDRLYAGMGYDANGMILHRYGLERPRSGDIPAGVQRLWMRLENDHHVVTGWFSLDGERWEKFGVQMEVSGYHHNTVFDFLSLRPALYAAGSGKVRFSRLVYRGQCAGEG